MKQQESLNAGKVLFEVPAGGLSTAKWLIKNWFFRRLFLLSRKHLEEGRRQLVVFSFDFIGHHINLDGIFERGELDTFFGWLSRQPGVFDGVAIDVGANIGNHSLYFSDFYPKVYSFEPNPRTFQVLKLNASLATNVTCFEHGISDSERNAELNVYANNMGHSDISAEAGVPTVGIKLKTLDASIPGEEVVRLMKFDVEGHEYQAIQGSLALIERHRPVVLFEQWPSEIESGTSRVIELLRTCGYKKFASVKKATRRLHSPNGPINGLLAVLNRLPIAKSFLFGTTWTVQVQQTFERADYPFIVAIPDWVDVGTA